MSEHIKISREGAVLHVTMARPDKKNALSSAMYEAMLAALEEAERDDAVRCVMFQGSGGVFTAGNDIGDFLGHARDMFKAPGFRFIKALAACQTPMVAAVEGVAVGIGTTMLLHCDLAYAAPSAMFKMPFVDLGLVPEAGSSLLLPELAGMKKATELLMLSESFDAAEALRIGLINAVVPAEKLIAHAGARAQLIAAKPAAALKATRRLMRGDPARVTARIDEEGVAFAKALASPEARGAFMQFMERGKKG